MSLSTSFASPTFNKEDLKLLNQKIDSSSTQIYSQKNKPALDQGKDGDIVTVTGTSKVFKKTKFPILNLFPEFSGTVWKITDGWSANTGGFRNAWAAAQSGDIIELTSDIIIPENETTREVVNANNRNILVRSAYGSKFAIMYRDSNITSATALFSNNVMSSVYQSGGLCMKDLIIRNISNPYTADKYAIDLRADTNVETFNHHFDNVSFEFVKSCINMEAKFKDLQLTNCTITTTGVTAGLPGTNRFIYLSGCKNLYLSKCTVIAQPTSGSEPNLLRVISAGEGMGFNTSLKKITGDIFLDGLIDQSALPNMVNRWLAFQDINIVDTSGANRKPSIYMKDCLLKHVRSTYILFSNNGGLAAPPPFSQFQDIVLYNNVYQNNQGKGLVSWDWGASATVISGAVGGNIYSELNQAVQSNFFATGWGSLITFTSNAIGENQHFGYTISNVQAGSTITAIVQDSWSNVSRWVEQPQIPIAVDALVTSGSFSSTQSWLDIMNLDLNATANGYTIFLTLNIASSGNTSLNPYLRFSFNNPSTNTAVLEYSLTANFSDFGTPYGYGDHSACGVIGPKLWQNTNNTYMGILVIRRESPTGRVWVRTTASSFPESNYVGTGGQTLNTTATWKIANVNVTSMTFNVIYTNSSSSLVSSSQATSGSLNTLLSGNFRVIRNF